MVICFFCWIFLFRYYVTRVCSVVPKNDGSCQPCGDYRRLNTVTTPDRYPLPNMQDLANNGLHGCTVISKIDLVKEYHQVPIAAADIPNCHHHSLWTV